MTNPLEGIVDPDNDFPRRPLNPRRLQAWIDTRNPYPKDSAEWLRWNVRLLLDQARAGMDPHRSWSAWAMRYVMWPLLLVAVFFNFAIGIYRLANP
jgi:hypothetical protein